MLWQVCVDVCQNLTCLEFAMKTCYRTRWNSRPNWTNWNCWKLSRVVASVLRTFGLVFLLLANDVPDANQIPVLLSLIGGKTNSLLRELCAPAKTATKAFAQLTEILGNHHLSLSWLQNGFDSIRETSRKAKQSRNMLHKLESSQNIVNSQTTWEILFEMN